MNYSVVFKARSFGEMGQPGIPFRVSQMGWAAVGGPKSCRLSASLPAGKVDLSLLIGLLRRPVEIWDAAGRCVWYGLVNSVAVQDGAAGARVSLDDLANKLQVLYSDNRPSLSGAGQAVSTGWLNEFTSQTAFGVKERIYPLMGGNAAQAEAYAARMLARDSLLQLRPLMGAGTGSGECQVSVDCCGWWQTLGWRYYASSAGLVENVNAQQIPWTELLGVIGQEKTMLGIAIGAKAWRAEGVWLCIKQCVGVTPTYPVTVGLYTSASLMPGSLLASGSVDGASLSTANPRWTYFAFSTPYLLSKNTNYVLVVSVGGTVADPFYCRTLMTCPNIYVAGLSMFWDGASWNYFNVDAALQFRLTGTMETTEQIRYLAAATGGGAGQFLSGVRIDQASGLFTNPYRAGDQSARVEIEQLLEGGTAAGKRLLARIGPERSLIVTQQPEPASARYKIGRDGCIRLASGMPAPPGPELAGEWAALDVSWAAAADRVFLEEVRWDIKDSFGMFAVVN